MSPEYAVASVIYLALMFLIGFIPGYYLSYLALSKVKIKINRYLKILFSLIIGLIIGNTSFSYSSEITNFLNIYNTYSAGILYPLIAILEVLLVFVHYFFFLRRRKKR